MEGFLKEKFVTGDTEKEVTLIVSKYIQKGWRTVGYILPLVDTNDNQLGYAQQIKRTDE